MKILIIEEGFKSEEYLIKLLKDNGFKIQAFPGSVLMLNPDYVENKKLLMVKDLILNRNIRKVYIKDKEVKLQPIMYSTLEIFMINAGIILSRENLLANVWGYNSEVETRVVDNCVFQINKRLGKKYIKGVNKIGYLMEI